MAGWATGPYGTGPWGGGVFDLQTITSFIARNTNPNEISLSWEQPLNFDGTMEIIVVRRKDSFPVELFNDDPIWTAQQNVSGFTDPVQVEIFRGKTIRGSAATGAENLLTDALALFPTSPPLNGRILRDSTGHNFRIISNTATTITVDGTPASGQYVVLADFPNSNDPAITGTSTSVGSGFLRDTSKIFTEGSLKDRILVDSSGTGFVIVSNGTDLVSVSGTPTAGDYTILQEFVDFISPSETFAGQFAYIDNHINAAEAAARVGTGLEDEQFYYYTAMTHRGGGTAAEVVFGLVGDLISTQAAGLSTIDRDFHEILTEFWPKVFSVGDPTGDFEDLMKVFGFGFNQIYSRVNTFDLTNPDRIFHTVLPEKVTEFGLSDDLNQVGVDAQRRVMCSMLPTYKLKGTKSGIADFIRIITTWDVTNGTKDDSSILDGLANVDALRFFDSTLGTNNTRLFGFLPAFTNDPFVSYTYTGGTGIIQYGAAVDLSDVEAGDTFVDGAGVIFDIFDVDDAANTVELDVGQTVDTTQAGDIYKKTPLADVGRFFTTLPGVVIPGFFDFREFVVEVKDVALFVGESTNLEILGSNLTRLTDTAANFGGVNTLVGNFLIPKQGQINDIFRIVSNTATDITVEGVAGDTQPIGDYAVLSPLNATRFLKIIALMEEYAPSFARMGIQFT